MGSSLVHSLSDLFFFNNSIQDFHSHRGCGKGSRSIVSLAQAASQRGWEMVTVCSLFFVFPQTLPNWTSTCWNITYEHFFSQLFGVGSTLMFALPVMQLFLPSVSCCYNEPFPIHVISKGEKTAWKQNKENTTKENQGFFQRPIWCTSINRKKMPEEVGGRNCTSRQLLTCVVSSTWGSWMVNK